MSSERSRIERVIKVKHLIFHWNIILTMFAINLESESAKRFAEDQEAWGFPKFIERDFLLNTSKGLLSDDRLVGFTNCLISNFIFYRQFLVKSL